MALKPINPVCLDCAAVRAGGGTFCPPCDFLRMEAQRTYTREQVARWRNGKRQAARLAAFLNTTVQPDPLP